MPNVAINLSLRPGGRSGDFQTEFIPKTPRVSSCLDRPHRRTFHNVTDDVPGRGNKTSMKMAHTLEYYVWDINGCESRGPDFRPRTAGPFSGNGSVVCVQNSYCLVKEREEEKTSTMTAKPRVVDTRRRTPIPRKHPTVLWRLDSRGGEKRESENCKVRVYGRNRDTPRAPSPPLPEPPSSKFACAQGPSFAPRSPSQASTTAKTKAKKKLGASLDFLFFFFFVQFIHILHNPPPSPPKGIDGSQPRFCGG